MIKNVVSRFSQFKSDYFNNGDERAISVRRNTLTSLIFKGGTILISLLLIRLTISYVNPKQYGIWLTLSSLIAWFNFFDIGLGHGLRNKIAESKAKGEDNNIRIYISSTYGVLVIIATVLFLSYCLINPFLNWSIILNVGLDNNLNLTLISLIVFGSFCLQFVFQAINNVLTAFHEPGMVTVINFFGQLLTLVTIFILSKYTSGSLLYLAIALTGVPILVLFAISVYLFLGKYKQYSPSFRLVNLSHTRELFGLGGLFFAIQIGGLVLFQTDNIVITQLFGPSEVTVFNISYKLYSLVTMVFTIIMAPYWSAFTDSYTKGDFSWIKRVFKKIYRYFFYSMIATIILFFASPHIINVWIGNSIAVPISVSLSMILYVAGFCWLTIHCYLLNGIGKIRVQFYLYIVFTILNIPIAIFLGKIFGISGVILANVFVFFVMGLVLYIQCKKILNQNAQGIWLK